MRNYRSALKKAATRQAREILSNIKDFHNTIDAQGDELKQHEAKAENQSDRILKIFKSNPERDFTPCEIEKKLWGDAPLLTSVRRSITNLTRDGKLERTETRRLGAHGAMNYTWRLRRKPDTAEAQGSLGLDDFRETGF